MDNEILNSTEKIFDQIKHIDENNNEYWYARELMEVLGYKSWDKFKNNVIEKAKISCDNANANQNEHFSQSGKMLNLANGASNYIADYDYKLTRYACYLIAQNGSPTKKQIALAQTYFAIKTRQQELTEKEYSQLSEDEKRLYRRRQTKDGNLVLYKIAKEKGVKIFDKFTNAGYQGLYNGETANNIAKRKGLRYREDILDNMGSVELGANIFRITQTEALLEKQIAPNGQVATNTHYTVGKVIRDTIKQLGGTMPEDLPTPKKSIKELEKERKNQSALIK